ncbi:MAG: SDR family oxidoreductase [Verrucomicrobiota bacterium]|nr:SDR family oxidoreductase [Verrucomicrobiota bacterium]
MITGASAGLGAEFARQLAPHASALILAARRTDRLDALKAEFAATHPRLRVQCYSIDLTDPLAIEEFVRWIWDEGFRVHVLINNAGLGDHGPFENSDWAKVKSMLDVNVSALTKLTHHLLPMLRGHRHAAILNVSSTVGFLPMPHLAVYAATKAYVTSFSEALRAELRGTRISVTALCPGPVDTEFSEVASRGGTGMRSPDFLKVGPERVVRSALCAVASDRARVLPGWQIALIVLTLASLPMFLLRVFLGMAAARERQAE